MKKLGTSLVALLVCQSIAVAQGIIDRALGAPTDSETLRSTSDFPRVPRAILGPPEVAPDIAQAPPAAAEASAAPKLPPAVYSTYAGTYSGVQAAAPSSTSSGSGTPWLPAGPLNPPRADKSYMFWGSAEYVSWWVQGSRLPPLVTTSPAGTPLANAGVLGAPGTGVLLGDERVNGEMRPGGRFALGFWFNDAHSCGLETDMILIGGRSSNFFAGSDGSQIISRPYVNAMTGMETAENVSFPHVLSGSVAVRSESDPIIIADAVLRFPVCCYACGQVDFLVGYRYLYLAENLQIQENLTSLDPFSLGTTLQVGDHFATRNEFNGGLIGLDTKWNWRFLTLQVYGKLALGNLNREVTIDGNTVVAFPGAAPLNYPGGLLALQSNSGTFSSNRFVLIPELGTTVGCQITKNIRATAGYSLLWMTDMVRPAEQIDRTVNTNLLPPPLLPTSPTRPTFIMRESDIWMQGVRLGLEFRF